MKMILIDERKNKHSQHLMRMMHHPALNGMEKITVVHMMLCLQFYSVYGYQSPRSGKKIFKDSNQYLCTLHDGFQKYLSGVCTLETAHDTVHTLLHDQDLILFPSGHKGCSVSALAAVLKVPQLHPKCSHCNHTIIINSYCVSRVMHVAYSASGSISQILENHMYHQSQQVCGNCTDLLETKIHFNDTHNIYAVDVTNRHVTLSKTVKIQGSASATTLHLKGLVYDGNYHFNC